MAFTPCAADGTRYSGGANTFFIRLVQGTVTVGGRLQFCAGHADMTMQWMAKHAIPVSRGKEMLDYEEPPACVNAGCLLTDTWALFVNAYPRGQTETQWYGQVCGTCAPAVAEDLHLEKAS